MIVVRNVFHLEFGKAKEARILVAEMHKLVKKHGDRTSRFLTDLTGTFYTLVMETSYKNLSEYEKESEEVMGKEDFEKWYKKFVPLVREGYREIFTAVD